MHQVVVIPEPISDWMRKGEVIDRYLNPGDLFDEVTLIVCSDNDDSPEAVIQRLVGSAKFSIFSVPYKRFHQVFSLGGQPEFLRFWARGVDHLIKGLAPDLIRAFGASHSGYMAHHISRKTGKPLVTSVHTEPTFNVDWQSLSLLARVYYRFNRRLVAHVARKSDAVIAVYSPIVSFLEKVGVEKGRIHLIGNFVNQEAQVLVRQRPGGHLRIVTVGRLVSQKSPEVAIKALALSREMRLTIVGDGPLRPDLEILASELGIADRVTFTGWQTNSEVIRILSRHDVFACFSTAHEFPKSVIEAALVGLPVVANRDPLAHVTEFDDIECYWAESTPESYSTTFRILEDRLRDSGSLVSGKLETTRANWAPDVLEKKHMDLLRSLLEIQ